MQIIKKAYQIKIIGKCVDEKDIMQLWNFGYSKEGIAKQYAKDNKIKIAEARNFVIKTLYNNIKNKNKTYIKADLVEKVSD